MKLDNDQINYLNIGLMLVSGVLAFVIPFELFLFSYAVLGPLHYLTEISWLHDRGYFVESKRDKRIKFAWLLLVFATLAVMLYGLYREKYLRQDLPPVYEIGMFYLVFFTALLMMFVRKISIWIALVVLVLIALFVFSDSKYYALTAFFLITIIHVFVFTAAFILYGSLKSRSLSGILSLAVFIACVVSFFVYRPNQTLLTTGAFVKNSYGSFSTLNAELIKFFGLGAGTKLSEIYDSAAGLVVMRLIAFAYTYHYLNWFSKTSIIKWHEISTARTVGVIGLWIVSLLVYGYDYQLGMSLLYFLSVLHVMLEFPLNHQTFAGIGRELGGLVTKRA
ncbi:MAG: hypothetical protein ABIZ95_00175 [Pyrinomonadaceae bacterium]